MGFQVRLGTFCEIGNRLLFKLQILQLVIGQILHFKTGTYRLLGVENFFAEKNFEPNLCQQKIYALESRGPYCELAPQWHVWAGQQVNDSKCYQINLGFAEKHFHDNFCNK